jgi:hypothetical protein
MDVWLLTQEGAIRVPRAMQARPDTFRTTLAPSRDGSVVAVACLWTWYGRADLWAQAGLPLGLGPALSRPALQGGKAHNARRDARNIAVRRRAGMLPQASVAPAERRATRARLRRRLPRARQRGALLAPGPQTTRP